MSARTTVNDVAPANLLRPIKRRSRDQMAIDALIDMIEVSGLTVGDRLPTEHELARRLGVGRSTIREALKVWQGMGIITRNKRGGTVLATEISSNSVHVPLTLKLEAESLLRTHSVRRPLEMEAARLAARLASDPQRQVVREEVNRLLAIFEAGDDWRAADSRFHGVIHTASGNPLFGQLIRQLQSVFHDIYEDPLGIPLLGEQSIPMHRDLADAVIAGEGDRAAEIMREISFIVDDEVQVQLNGK